MKLDRNNNLAIDKAQQHVLVNRFKECSFNESKPEDGNFTYRKLLEQMKKMSDEELDQSVQVYPPHNTPNVVPLKPVIAFDTVKELCADQNGENCQTTRSCVDNKHHPQQWVLLTDYNPFSEKGDTYYTWEKDGSLVGNVSGEVKSIFPRKKKMDKQANLAMASDSKSDEDKTLGDSTSPLSAD
jgi:hypothetical protein